MKSSADRKLAATAHHEAGHAVAAWCQRMKFEHVTIVPDKSAGNLGHLLHQRAKWFNPEIDSGDRVILRAQSHIIVSLAGQIAEARFLGRRPRYGMHSDNKAAVDMALYLCGSARMTNAARRFKQTENRGATNSTPGVGSSDGR